jgi:flagellar hook-length control protein FliK
LQAEHPTPPAAPESPSIAAALAPQSTQATQTAAPTPSALPTRYGVSLHEAVESVRSTIELGSRQGVSQARIELAPPSLGGIRIQLHKTDDGLTARVLTDNSTTADTLSHGGDDLRRALQSVGITLLRLDVETRGDGGAQTQERTQGSTPQHTRGGDQGDSDGEHGRVKPATQEMPGGALVNVLA